MNFIQKLRLCLVSASLLAPSLAFAADDEAALAELTKLRQEIAGEIQLAAYNLVDEMVYGFKEKPVFDQPTDVVLAGISVPVGMGSALQGLIENHLSSVLIKNPGTNLVLTHCPACTAVIVHSGPEGTIVSRGVDNPEAFNRLRQDGTSKHALFVDIAAEGTYLVLRARLTKLDESLTIVWARTISTAASTPSLLRQEDNIKSVEEAREELMDAVHDRWPLTIPAKLAVRIYNDTGTTGVIPPPFVWLMGGVELGLGDARAWTANVLLGYGYVPSSYDGFMAQVRVHRILTGTARSYTRPDLYAFVGGSVFTVWGPSAVIFRRGQLTTEDLLAAANGNSNPPQVMGALHTGLELRIGNRLGVSVFLETLPAHIGSDNLGTYFGIFQSIGTEISVWF